MNPFVPPYAKSVLYTFFSSVVLLGILFVNENGSTLLSQTNPTDILAAEIDVQTIEEPEVVEVTANNNVFDPSHIDITHFESTVLSITAVDADYTFQLPDFQIFEAIPKGETKQVTVNGLGLGDYRFRCGFDCTGIVTVIEQSDGDEVY